MPQYIRSNPSRLPTHARQCDGLAIIDETLYYHAVTAKTLYSIDVALLIDPKSTAAAASDPRPGLRGVGI